MDRKGHASTDAQHWLPQNPGAAITIDNMYPRGYTLTMIEIRKTEIFAKWLDGLRDIRARARILVRIERLAAGNPGGRC